MVNKKIIQYTVSLLILFVSCQVEKLDTEISDHVPVVEGYLVAGKKIELKVSELVTYSEETTEDVFPLSGLEIILSAGNENYAMVESEIPGTYISEIDSLKAMANSSYAITFLSAGDTISAASTVPGKPVSFSISDNVIAMQRIEEGSSMGGLPSFESASLDWNNSDESYHIVSVEYMESDIDYINANMVDQELPTTSTSNPIVLPGHDLTMRNLFYFGTYRIVLFKINQEYADLYETISQSSNNLTSPLTNINNGWGIFTGVNADTLYLEVVESK